MFYFWLCITNSSNPLEEESLLKFQEENEKAKRYICISDMEEFESREEAEAHVKKLIAPIELDEEDLNDYIYFGNQKAEYTKAEEWWIFSKTLVFSNGEKGHKAPVREVMNLNSLSPYVLFVDTERVTTPRLSKKDGVDTQKELNKIFPLLTGEEIVTVVCFSL